MPEGESRRPLGPWIWLVLAAGLVVAGVVGWKYAHNKPAAKADQITTQAGLYQQYAYIITTRQGQRDQTASFNPAVQADDAVVVSVLKDVMNTAYGDQVADSLQPQVENIDDKNYVSFTADGAKTYFQLFKNSKGEVGSVSFWRDSESNY